jgi:hypothetical protein
MRKWVGVLLCIGLVLSCAAAWADTIYRYRDKATGRDVFVNRLDQIPLKYRSEAKIVVESTSVPADNNVSEPGVTVVSSTGQPPEKKPVAGLTFGQDLQQALVGRSVWKDGPVIASFIVDAQLLRSGARPLTSLEREQFGSFFRTFLIVAMVFGILSLVIWVGIIIMAVRDGHPWWGLLIFLFSPLAYIYLFVHGGKGRVLFKVGCTLGMLSPALVGLVGAWRFMVWFQTVIQARGGHV